MEYVEGKHHLIAVGEYFMAEIQVLCSQAKNKDNPAPPANAHDDLKEYKYQGEWLISRVVVT